MQWPVKADWLLGTREKRDAATPAMLIKRVSSPRVGNRRKKKKDRARKKRKKKEMKEREKKRERETAVEREE